MKKKNRIAVIMVVLLGSLSFWFIVNNKNGTIKEALRDFAMEDTTSINKIFLADKKGNSVTLERNTKSGGWLVNGKYQARMDAINTLLVTMKRLDIKEPVGKKAQDNVVKQLAADAVKCEIYQNDKLVKAYYVGSHTQDMTGTYMILMDLETMKASAKPFVVYIPGFEGYLSTRYFTIEKMWRDRTIFHYLPTDIKSVKLEVPDSAKLGYELTVKGNNDYSVTMLADKKQVLDIDPLSVKQFLSYFQQVNFESMDMAMTDQEIDSTLKSKPINILTVTDNEGNVNKVSFYARKPKKDGKMDNEGKALKYDLDRMNAMLENTKDFVMVQYYVFGKMMPPASYFKKSSNPGSSPAPKTEEKPKS